MRFGLSHPVIAKRTGAGTYVDGFVCGHAMESSVNPQKAEGSVYADNRLVLERSKFTYADVVMHTDTLPKVAETLLFGHEASEDGTITSNVNDEVNEVGYGFVSKEEVDGATKHVAVIILRVKFSEGQNSYKTEGENIEFDTPSVSGKATAEENGDWRITKPFDTEDAAYEYIKTKLCITE